MLRKCTIMYGMYGFYVYRRFAYALPVRVCACQHNVRPCKSPVCTDAYAQPCADLATCVQRWCQVGGSGLLHSLEPAKT